MNITGVSVLGAVFSVLACSPPALPKPKIERVLPAEGSKGERIPIELEGVGLHLAIESSLSDEEIGGGVTLTLGGTVLEELVLVDEQHLRAVIPTTLQVGRHELTVVFSDGRQGTLVDAFFVTCNSAEDCSGDEVCDPATALCTSDLPCRRHPDCGGAAFCDDDDDDGQCVPNTSGGICDESLGCIAGELCTAGYCGCGGDFFGIRTRPNILLLLDRSSSMKQDLPGGQGSKWDVARQAVSQLLATSGDDANFGLMLYPGTNQDCSAGMTCSPGSIAVDVGPGTSTSISDYLEDADTCNMGTPTRAALESIASYPLLQGEMADNYVLLITDGRSSCADPGPAVSALRALPQDVRTFAVGFGSNADATELNSIATEGGTALPGDPMYYQADNANELSAALASISGTASSCIYDLSAVPPNPDLLFVYFGGLAIARDVSRTSGWDFHPGSNQIELYGDACTQVQSGQTSDVTISYGCSE